MQIQATVFKSMLDKQGSKYPGGNLERWSSDNFLQNYSKRLMRSQSNISKS